ncbi:MAG: nuclear transport factor 2 family protein [Planctomycetota bacterium]
MERRASLDVERQVRQLLKGWAGAVGDRDAERVVAYYDGRSAIVAGSMDPQIHRGREAILDYFQRLFDRAEVDVHFADLSVREYEDLALCHGNYTIRLRGEGAGTFHVRYMFAVENDGPHGWHIIEHHASLVPDPRI